MKAQKVRFRMAFLWQRGWWLGGLLLVALLFFEMFNYSTTDFALRDLLGEVRFAGLRWATILAIAFCGIDFAGIARLFTPQQGRDEPTEVWYLFGAWMLATTMNALLTWWGVSLAVLGHQALGNAILSRTILLKVVPVFVALLVWLIRVLLIGTFSLAGDRLFTVAPRPSAVPRAQTTTAAGVGRAATTVRAEPTYHPVGMKAASHGTRRF